MKKIDIYTDGACSGNPGPGGWGVYMCYTDDSGIAFKKEAYGSKVDTTNNQMELFAAINGLQMLKESCKVNLFTDSVYVKNGITSWIDSWMANGWKTSNKKSVKNVELWQELYTLTKCHTIDWIWVKGHAQNAGNIIADRLAVRGRNEALKLIKNK